MFGRNCKPIRPRRPAVRRGGAAVEPMESRTLMSASTVMASDAVYLRTASSPAVTSSTVEGFTPAQIRAAYGFADVTFEQGTVTADGSGQTIAIVDAYNDANVVADLNVFDAQFGLAAPPSLRVVNQTGGTGLPADNASWAGEIALDVEWAHAIAPGASILLVEATTDDTDNLLAAVNYARAAPGVSAVSMSWGGSEYVSFGGNGESTTQTTYDADFTTPAGHQGVTFVASAGDSGSTQSGAQWPASSPNVLSVGGTTLTLNADGTYASETGWSGTSGGTSQVESEPSYQLKVQSTGLRTVPDVAYDGDPNTGFAVYDSVAYQGVSGWQEVGGTSAGAPQWAALIAIANQGRASAGLATLNGVAQTLPDLYALYAASGSSGYAAYTGSFHDVTSGGTGSYHLRHGPGGQGSNAAAVGYDEVTGLGSPYAAAVIADLATAAADTGTGVVTSGGSGGGGGSNTSSVTLSPVAVTLLSEPPSAVVGGAAGTLKLRLTNTGSVAFVGPITLIVHASTDGTVSADDAVVTTVTLPRVVLKIGASRTLTVKFKFPTTLATGSYDLIASADATGTSTQPTTAASSPVTVTAPAVDLSVGFASTTAVAVTPGKKGKAVLKLTNLGNVTAIGSVVVQLYASASGAVDGSAVLLTTLTKKVKLGAGKTLTFAVPFTLASELAAGDVSLVAVITPTTTPTDANAANNTATAATQAP